MVMDYLVGVLGGMGPAATVDFMNKIIEMTDADGDQQHIPMLVSSIPNIPDRSAHFLRNGESPQSALIYRLRMLEKAGVSCVVMPCNTAHYWFPQLKAALSEEVEMLNLIDAVVEAVREAGLSRVGLLATDATVMTGMYQTALEKAGIEYVMPEGITQKAVMVGIYALKAGDLLKARDCLAAPCQYLQLYKAEALILGCTEIPLILAEEIRKEPEYYLDSNRILARATIRWYENKAGKRLLKPSWGEGE